MQIVSKTTLSTAAVALFSIPLAAQAPTAPTDAEVLAFLKDKAGKMAGVTAEGITRSTNFVNDLSFDSLDAIDLVMQLEQEYHIRIPDEDVAAAATVDALIEAVRKQEVVFEDPQRIRYAGYALNGTEGGSVLRDGKEFEGLYREETHEELIAPVYASVSGMVFTDYAYFKVTTHDGLQGVFDAKGREVLPVVFKKIDATRGGDYFTAVDQRGRNTLYDVAGQKVLKSKKLRYLDVDPSGRFVKVQSREGYQGIVDLAGGEIEPARWTDISFPNLDYKPGTHKFIFFRGRQRNAERAEFQVRDADCTPNGRVYRALVGRDFHTNSYRLFEDGIPSGIQGSYGFGVLEFPEGTVMAKYSLVDAAGQDILPSSPGVIYGEYDPVTQTVARKSRKTLGYGIWYIPGDGYLTRSDYPYISACSERDGEWHYRSVRPGTLTNRRMDAVR